MTHGTRHSERRHRQPVRQTITYSWFTSGSDSPVSVSTNEVSTDGLQNWIFNPAGTNKTRTVYSTAGYRYQTNTSPDGSFSVNQFQYGRLISTTKYDSATSQVTKMTYGYDPHGRQNLTTDARNGTTTNYFNSADLINGISTPAPASGAAPQIITNFFDNMGRICTNVFADGTGITNEYNVTGLLRRTYGSRNYPVGYKYDAQGRVTAMTNWSGFSGNSGVRVTTWNYDPYRGWLSSKDYPLASNGNPPAAPGTNGPSYTYTAAGRLLTRAWLRGVTTTYSYTAAGDLSQISYSDSTPAAGYAYDRMRRKITATQGAGSPLNQADFKLDYSGNTLSESNSIGPLSYMNITNSLDQFLRRTNLALMNHSTTVSSVGYRYDIANRLGSVFEGTNSATYSYIANSPLVSQIMFTNGSVLRMTTTKTYDLLNRLTNIVTTNASGTVASFRYVYNSANQRTSVTNADSSYWVYTYDSLGQVVSGKKYWSDGTPVAGQQYTYGFDDIGNRKTTGAGGDQSGSNLRTANYGANSLNQYTNRDVPGYVNLLGTANSNSTVSISRSGYSTIWPSTRHGTYFWGEIPLDNTTGVVSATLNTLAVLNNGSNPDLVSSNSGNVLLQQTQETFLYDLDGNLIRDGLWTNTWDGENRLISMQSRTNVPGAARQKLDFTYDWMSRRIQKVVSIWSGSAYTPQYTNRFAYDGWNMIGILNETNGLVSALAWGSDLSGSLQGAGGVGGLMLADVRTGTSASTNFVCFDGNGNVSALVSSTNSTVNAAYEYGPFGELIRVTGPVAILNPHRFSTKYEDDETGLLYYGHRYYSASLGRWWSRDPLCSANGVPSRRELLLSPDAPEDDTAPERSEIEESEIYAFVANSPPAAVDIFGLCSHVRSGAGTFNPTTVEEHHGKGGRANQLIFTICCPCWAGILVSWGVTSEGPPPYSPTFFRPHPFPEGWSTDEVTPTGHGCWRIVIEVPTRTTWFGSSGIQRVRIDGSCCTDGGWPIRHDPPTPALPPWVPPPASGGPGYFPPPRSGQS